MSDERTARMPSLLGPTALVLGNVTGRGDLEIRGRIQGNVVIDGRVLLARGGVVLGNIEALQITVHGQVRGDLSSSDNITIGAQGEIEGNLQAPRVGIEAGALVLGQLRTVDPHRRSQEIAAPNPALEKSPNGSHSRRKRRRHKPHTEGGVQPGFAEPELEARPAPLEVAPAPKAQHADRPPSIPTFVKGAHGHRRGDAT